MESKNGVPNDLGKAQESSKKVLSIKDVKAMLDRDLTVVSALLTCLSDEDVKHVLAVHLHGKYLNAKHKEELELQTDLKI